MQLEEGLARAVFLILNHDKNKWAAPLPFDLLQCIFPA